MPRKKIKKAVAKGELEILDAKSLDMPKRDELNQKNNVFIGTLNIFAQPLKDRHEKHYKDSRFHLIIDLILAGIIVILLAVIATLFTWNPKPDLVLKAFYENNNIVSGRLETFVLEYDHKSAGLLREANLTVKMPDNFKVIDIYPNNIYNSNSNIFSLGDLPGGANGKIKISGLVFGEDGEQQKISYKFSYIKNGKNFYDLSTLYFNVEKSVLELSFQVPPIAYQGINENKRIEIKNNGDYQLDLIEIFLANDDWEINEIQSAFDFKAEGRSIILKSLMPGEKRVFDLSVKTDTEKENSQTGVEVYLNTGGKGFCRKK
jgi:hypothetical protein